ncbi:hypothetical protein [Novipirellula maiorica]|uniref:hypothetical protein n=1 Tax=Novipirellula maiorica TaxID=1265734 RepID=UPI0011818D08|nr:hypothetical protein [Rhodopirellula maiorica]
MENATNQPAAIPRVTNCIDSFAASSQQSFCPIVRAVIFFSGFFVNAMHHERFDPALFVIVMSRHGSLALAGCDDKEIGVTERLTGSNAASVYFAVTQANDVNRCGSCSATKCDSHQRSNG